MSTSNWNGQGRTPAGFIDQYSGAKVALSEEHWVIHKGLAFMFHYKATGVANGASVEILLANPNGNYPHLHAFDLMAGSGGIDMYLFEDTTVSAAGTAVSTFNPNRNSTNTPNLVVTHTPTVTGAGTELFHLWLPPTATGVGVKNGIIRSQEGMEWIAKNNANSLIRITNNSGGAIDIMLRVMFYELENFG